MQKHKLKNNLTVLYKNKLGNCVTLHLLVKVGSNYEHKTNYGISHFIEHMLFEGTKKRPTSFAITNEIEKLGGELNAYTTKDRTCFYIRVLNKHFDVALDILSDILQNSLFDKKALEKERKVIMKEINMVTDDSRNHQWVLFLKKLFSNHPAKNPTYGSKKTVAELNRKDLLKYFKNHYVPNNMILSVVGGIKDPITKIESKLSSLIPKKIIQKKFEEPKRNSKKIIKERRDLLNSYFILGYKTPPRLSKESYALDVVRAVLGRGQSGKLFDEIRNKYGFAYDIGLIHDPCTDYGYFAVYLSADKKNLGKITEIICQEFEKLKNITAKELHEAKTFIEGEFALDNEDTHNFAEELSYWEMVKDCSLFDSYLKNIKKVTKKDITKVVYKYLTKNYTIAIIEQKK